MDDSIKMLKKELSAIDSEKTYPRNSWTISLNETSYKIVPLKVEKYQHKAPFFPLAFLHDLVYYLQLLEVKTSPGQKTAMQ